MGAAQGSLKRQAAIAPSMKRAKMANDHSCTSSARSLWPASCSTPAVTNQLDLKVALQDLVCSFLRLTRPPEPFTSRGGTSRFLLGASFTKLRQQRRQPRFINMLLGENIE